ncbi:hypothetical protein B9Z55_015720 [Caenorhabditis nigoni]|uniref:Yippee domain-containing protein n=1 Tax=Caenorhabditis nigoni TaxID=1611254 RepID=A0A2G5UC25_9PELO|nr:hypothetical protein B9Z55_015720 [Caenorhabditis nigoni]
MGRKFVCFTEVRGESVGCAGCRTYITCEKEITSTAFTGSTGSATLFKKAWNIYHGDMGKREMTTGVHMVRDVHCSNCRATNPKTVILAEIQPDFAWKQSDLKKLGWMYEFALVPSQTYKEGQVILENALVVPLQREVVDPISENDKRPPTTPPIETARHRTSSGMSSRTNSESSTSSHSSSSDFHRKH